MNEHNQNQVITKEMFEAYQTIKNKYVHDEESFRLFFFYLDDFCQLVRVDMDETAIEYQCRDHYKTAGERVGESRQTIWRATKESTHGRL